MNLRSIAHVRQRLAGRSAGRSVHPLPDRESAVHVTPRDAGPVAPEASGRGTAETLVRAVGLPDTAGAAPSAVAIRDGTIQWIGPDRAAAERASPDTRTIAGRGRTLLPGMTDSHVHLTVGSERLDGLDAEGIRDREALRAAIRGFAAQNPERPVLYVYGLHYLDPPLISREAARQELDALVPDRPLFVHAHDLHTGWTNSRALDEAGLLRPMPPYPLEIEELGAADNVETGPDGVPTGELREPDAYFLVEATLRVHHPEPLDRKLDCLEHACRELARFGITTVHNMGLALPEEDLEELSLLLELERLDRLPLRVFQSCSVVPDEHMLADVALAADLRDLLAALRAGEIDLARLQTRLGSLLEQTVERRLQLERPGGGGALHNVHRLIEELHVKAHLRRLRSREALGAATESRGRPLVHLETVKLFVDGVMEKHTAYRCGGAPRVGLPAFSAAELNETVRTADALGLQVAAHCIGEGAVHLMLDAVEYARQHNASLDEQRGHRIRHRVEHIELCLVEDVPRFAELDVIASMQPFHERPPTTLWHQTVDRAWWGMAFTWKRLRAAGATLVFGSDWPIVSCDCLAAVRHVRARESWGPGLENQGLPLAAALDGFCRNPPVAVHQERVAGQLTPGRLADLVLLDGRLGGTADDLDPELAVVATICDGRVVYQRA